MMKTQVCTLPPWLLQGAEPPASWASQETVYSFNHDFRPEVEGSAEDLLEYCCLSCGKLIAIL